MFNEKLKDYNPTKKKKVLIMLDDVIPAMVANKNLSPIVAELFLRWKKN